MVDIDIALLKRKSLAGVVAMTTRTFVLQIIAFSATFLLTIFLSPSVFGVFYVVSAVISFLGYFSDIGLAAALIQKKEEISREDLITTFTIQQVLVGIIVVAGFLLSSFVSTFYGLDGNGLWLYLALIVSLFLSSLKTIPSIILERELDFQKLVIPTIVETVAFYVVAVFLAWQDFGIMSFTWAVIARGITGVITIYVIAPWQIGIGFSRKSARTLLRFGIPFQLNSFLSLVKDDLMIIFLGKVLPFAHVGYIGWAKKWAEVPLRLFMDGIIRVTFPAFSRLQHDKNILGSAIEKTLFGLSATIFPVTVGLIFFIEPIVFLVPKYGKWEPALLSFYFFAISSAIASMSTPLANAFNAVGKIKITLGFMIFWTASTWIITPWLLTLYGFNGYSIALLIIAFSIIAVVVMMKHISPFGFWKSIGVPCIAAFLQAAWYLIFRGSTPYVVWQLLVVGVSGGILYVGIVWYVENKRIRSIFSHKTI